ECPSSAHFGGDVDTILIRPQLHLPEALQVFQHLARCAGWTANVSDKGFFSQDTINKQDGLERCAAMVRDQRSRAVLWKYLRSKPKAQSTRKDEVFLYSAQRWYLALGGITPAFGDEAEGVTFLDDLLNRQILHRGTILTCGFCRSADWFPLAE